MGSYIDEFEDEDGKKKSDIVIAIGGPSKSGKSTLAKHISDFMGIEHFSAGDFFRSIADEKGITVEELSENADKETDIEVDRRTFETGLKKNCVIDGRLVALVLGDYADLTLFIDTNLNERARRFSNMKEIDVEEARKRIKKRDKDNHNRYMNYYGIQLPQKQIYDEVIDNTELSIEQQNNIVEKILEERFKEHMN